VSEELLRWAFDRSPNGMSVVALDGRWLRINDAYCRLLGYEPAELVGASVIDVTHPDDVAEAREFVASAVAGRLDSAERDKRYVAKDGSVVWARVRAEIIRDDGGAPLYFVSHVQDIAERRAAKDLVRDSERTLRSVIDNTPAVICVKGRDHRYKLVNREFEQMFGVSSDWIVGRSDAEVLPAAKIDEIRAKDLLVLDGGQVAQEEETTLRDGQERVFLTTRFPLLDEDGEIHALCLTSADITERRREERAKRERLECSELIYAALAQERFVLYGQPIVDLATMERARTELLIRMKRRGGGNLLAPGEFLPAAERFDLISVIDEWVVDQAIAIAGAGHRITVNVSAMTISDPRQVDRIEQAVLADGAAPGNLVFEITETAVADNLDAARTFGMRMRQLRCGVALDDLGVGHGTFT
jgi:PAS domain S-box-containing protein